MTIWNRCECHTDKWIPCCLPTLPVSHSSRNSRTHMQKWTAFSRDDCPCRCLPWFSLQLFCFCYYPLFPNSGFPRQQDAQDPHPAISQSLCSMTIGQFPLADSSQMTPRTHPAGQGFPPGFRQFSLIDQEPSPVIRYLTYFICSSPTE